MFGFIKKLFGGTTEEVAAAPYKVEAPVTEAKPAVAEVKKQNTNSGKPAQIKAKPKAPGQKKQGGQKPAGAKKGPRKPKPKA
jgi:hypothetical protein